MRQKTILGLGIAVLMGFLNGAVVCGLSLEELIGLRQAGALVAGEKPVLVQFKKSEPGLVPQSEVLKVLVDSVHQDLDPSVMVETLHLYKKPPEAEKPVWSADEEARIYNELLSLSTLTGIQYFSASRGAMRILYENSFVVDDPSSKKPVSDPVYSAPPAELTIYARQKDSTFGENVYQYDYYAIPGAIIFTQENLTSLTYGIIPAVGKNKLRSAIAILDAGDYLLVYAVSMAKAASIPGMNDRIGNSFANRAEAIIHWFSDHADKAFKR